MIKKFIKDNLLPDNIEDAEIPLYDDNNPRERLNFNLSQCLLKDNIEEKNIDNYEIEDMEWKLSLGMKNIVISTIQLFQALFAEEKYQEF